MAISTSNKANIQHIKSGTSKREFSNIEKILLNDFQRDFPVSATPFSDIAQQLGVDTDTVLQILQELKTQGSITRIGPVFKPNSIGRSLLAALSVPADHLEHTADLVNSYMEVNHNYEREHEFNLWFVVNAANDTRIHAILDEIEERTGLPLLRLPIIEDYHIDLGFDINWN